MQVKFDGQHNKFGVVGKSGNFVPLVTYKPDSKTLVRRVDSNHFFGKFQGYGLNSELVDYMQEKTSEETPLYIVKNNTGEVWKTKIKDWKMQSVKVNYGYGEQYILPVRSMEKIK